MNAVGLHAPCVHTESLYRRYVDVILFSHLEIVLYNDTEMGKQLDVVDVYSFIRSSLRRV